MQDRFITESRIQCYLLGLLSPEEEDWIELCYDGDPRLQELFRKNHALPFHLCSPSTLLQADADDATEEPDDSELSTEELLAEIRSQSPRLDALLKDLCEAGNPLEVAEEQWLAI